MRMGVTRIGMLPARPVHNGTVLRSLSHPTLKLVT